MALPGRDLPLQKLHVPWQQTHSVGAGLFNLGNTGFVNSVLQCLTHTAPLASYMLSRQHSQSCVQQGFCMMCTLQAHVHEVLSCSGSAVSPEGVISQLPRIGQHFQLGNQEDAHEFFYYAMDAMQRACLSRDSDWNTSQASRVIDQVFTGFLQSRGTFQRYNGIFDSICGKQLLVHSSMASTSIAVRIGCCNGQRQVTTIGIHNCLCLFSRCKQLTRVAKRLTIHHCPNILTLCLKRFDPFSGRKINSVVKYPAYLHLGAYMSEAPEIPLIYSLYAVLVHQGHSCYEGHYYCFVKASNGRWYKMDDESVVPCDTKTVLSQQAYLLFYTR
ncbi:UBP42 hydrolase, partial [Podargus strigoides]|nr:UBP42 hydrolase [Podargus strigoides]